MRFRFVDPNTPDGRARAALEARFDQFWAAVRDEADALDTMLKSRGPIADWMHARLPLLDAGLEWEFGPDERGDWKLVLTAASNRGIRPAVDRMVELAPQLPGWSFVNYRQPEPAAMAPILLGGRAGPGARPIENATFRVVDAPHGLIGIECFATNATAEPLMRAIATLLTEILVGEQTYDAWIGPIELLPTPKRGLLRRATPPADAVAPDALRGTVERMIAERVARLPDRPRCALSLPELVSFYPDAPPSPDGWAAYELKASPPDAAGDWPGMSDRLFATVREPTLFHATLAFGFDSRRFSRVGERFAYLKIEAGIWPHEEVLDRREAIFDALERALREARVGCPWATAAGMRYVYIELALADVDAAIPLIRAAAAEAGVGERSWLLFHDADFVDEWVGLTPDAPAPPRASDPSPQ